MRRDVYKEDMEGVGEVWTFTPGNGTLYKFIVVRFPEGKIGGEFGVVEGPGIIVVSHLRGRHAYLFNEGAYLTPSYVAEKFDVRGEDLAATITALGVILGREIKTYEEWVEDIINKEQSLV